ncbi:MAG: hypothetical protein OXC46_04675 [Thaumarchaeota archaeon]|nr:hypothetical protein [Nitrososphaerota archaeon]
MSFEGSSTNLELGWSKDIKEFTVSAISNDARMASYCYAPKSILKMLNNLKTP